MLRGLRKASSNWLGKTVMFAVVAFLVLSFVIWGIGDIFRGFGASTVAKVGKTEIGIEQFRQLYNDRLQQIGRQIGRPITADMARAIGLDRQVLGQVIAETALDERARQWRLTLSDAEVGKRIAEEPAFRNITGQFDPARFQQLIRQAGYTEQRFVSEQRKQSVRRQLATALSGDIKPPNAAIDAFARYEGETRNIEYVLLDAKQAGEVPPATPEELAKYFEDHKVLFRAPEYRKLTILTLSPEEIAKTLEISDADAKRVYDERLTRYTTPEQRQIQQIVFPNAEDARKGADELTGGKTFDQLAADRNLTEKDLDLGLIPKSAIFDPAIAAAAFSLAEGAVSAPVTGRFGATILRVTKIEAGHVRPFAEVEAEVKQTLALERSKSEMGSRRDKIEDEIASGTRLAEVGKKLDMPVVAIEAVDRSGRAPDGQPVPGLPTAVDVLVPAFASEVEVENDALQAPGGGLVWFDVIGITRSRERPLDEVKPQVEQRWKEEEVTNRLNAKAAALLDKVKAGSSFEDAAKADGLNVLWANGIKRQSTDVLPPASVADIYRTAKGETGRTEGKDPADRVVFRVTDVITPAIDPASEQGKKISDQLKNAMADELLSQYVVRLQTDLGTSINQVALDQAIGRTAPQ